MRSIRAIAEETLACAHGWEDNAMLIGNVRADEMATLAAFALDTLDEVDGSDSVSLLQGRQAGMSVAAAKAVVQAHADLHPTGACTCCGEGRCAWCQRTMQEVDSEQELSSSQGSSEVLVCKCGHGLAFHEDGPCFYGASSALPCPCVLFVARTKEAKARLDSDGTAKPKTEIVGVYPVGKKNFYHNAEELIVRPTEQGTNDACVVKPGADLCGLCDRGTEGCTIFHDTPRPDSARSWSDEVCAIAHELGIEYTPEGQASHPGPLKDLLRAIRDLKEYSRLWIESECQRTEPAKVQTCCHGCAKNITHANKALYCFGCADQFDRLRQGSETALVPSPEWLRKHAHHPDDILTALLSFHDGDCVHLWHGNGACDLCGSLVTGSGDT
jgi:hypothetical protein